MLFMGVTGFSMAASTRVSNSLGAGCPRTARRAIWTALAMTSTLQLGAMAGIVLLRHSWALLFTGASSQLAAAAAASAVLAAFPVLVAWMWAPSLSRGMLGSSTGAIPLSLPFPLPQMRPLSWT